MKRKHVFTLMAPGVVVGIGVLFLASHSALAQIATCDGPSCGVSDIYTTIDAIIIFLMKLMVPLGAVGFAIAGFIILFSGGNEGRIAIGKQMMWGVLFGMLLMLFAYIIVKTLLQVLV
jgi:hypothetical protein